MRITHLIKILATLGAERLVVKLSKGMMDIDRTIPVIGLVGRLTHDKGAVAARNWVIAEFQPESVVRMLLAFSEVSGARSSPHIGEA